MSSGPWGPQLHVKCALRRPSELFPRVDDESDFRKSLLGARCLVLTLSPGRHPGSGRSMPESGKGILLKG